jgi:hypothetical protein
MGALSAVLRDLEACDVQASADDGENESQTALAAHAERPELFLMSDLVRSWLLSRRPVLTAEQASKESPAPSVAGDPPEVWLITPLW